MPDAPGSTEVILGSGDGDAAFDTVAAVKAIIKALNVDPVTLVVDEANIDKPEVSASAQKSSLAGDQEQARHELYTDVEGEKASTEGKQAEVVTGLAPLPGAAPPINTSMQLPVALPPLEPSELLPTAKSEEVSESEEGTMNTADKPKVKFHISLYRILSIEYCTWYFCQDLIPYRLYSTYT
jgi:hypothetical protein